MESQPQAQTLDQMLLERFAQRSPLAATMRFALERLFNIDELNALYEAHRERQYTGKILFSSILEVMLAVVTGKAGSAHAAMKRHGNRIGASVTALYNKLNGMETSVSAALIPHSFQRGRELLAAMGGLRAEPLPGWRLRILDGNHLAATERRLGVLWGVAAGPLPGLALVAFDVAAMMMSDVLLCEDGHASERSLTTEILQLVNKGDCWIADRNFCTYEILFGMRSRGADFVVRHHGGMEGEPVGRRHARGRCETGRLYEQDYVLTHGGQTHTLRRITVQLDTPTRDQDTDVHILSSLPRSVSAAQIAELYRSRWTIESAFHDLARWLDAEIAPLGYPRAALLGFCVGLMAYNAISTLLGAMRATYGEAFVREQVSGYYLAQFGRDAVGTIDDIIEPGGWEAWQVMPVAQAALLLKSMAARIDLKMVKKSKRGPKKPVPKRTKYKDEPHVSTRKLLDGTAKKERSKSRSFPR